MRVQSTGATTWVRPTGPPTTNEGGGGSASAPAAAAASGTGLPEGWKAVTHAATGEPFSLFYFLFFGVGSAGLSGSDRRCAVAAPCTFGGE